MHTTEGIVLNRINSGEMDEIVVLYTKDFGKIRVKARGIKKAGAKLRGHLEPFSHTHISFVLGKYGEQITHAILVSSWPYARSAVYSVGAAYYIARVVEQYCLLGEKDEDLWNLLVKSFSHLEIEPENGEGLGGKLNVFDKEFIQTVGYGEGCLLADIGISVRRPFGI